MSISFQNSQGNLQLALYNSAGTLLAISQGTGNSETVSLNGRAAGTYYVEVFGLNGALNPNYSLTINPPTTSTTTTSSGFQITLSMTGLTASQQAIFQAAAARWSQVITGDLPNATYRGQAVDDLLINASAVSIDGVGGILGQSGPDAFRAVSDLPYHGIMQFDSADHGQHATTRFVVQRRAARDRPHPGHRNHLARLWACCPASAQATRFSPAQATAAYNQLFGTNARGVPVEATGGSGTALSHWRESVFTNELMTGWAGPGTNLPLSIVTVAFAGRSGLHRELRGGRSVRALRNSLVHRQPGGGFRLVVTAQARSLPLRVTSNVASASYSRTTESSEIIAAERLS